MGLFPGAGPAGPIILATPNEPDLPGDLLQIIEHEINHILPIRFRKIDRFERDGDSKRTTKASSIQLPCIGVIETLPQVLAEIGDQLELALHLVTLRRRYVDVSFAHDLAPAGPKQIDILPTNNSQMPMPRTPLLSFGHRNVEPFGVILPHVANKPGQVGRRLRKVGLIAAVG